MAAGDFVFGDDYESTFVCPAGPMPAITGTISPASISTVLGTQNRYLVKVYSCGFSGTVTFTPERCAGIVDTDDGSAEQIACAQWGRRRAVDRQCAHRR
jgi:hypothetical protein